MVVRTCAAAADRKWLWPEPDSLDRPASPHIPPDSCSAERTLLHLHLSNTHISQTLAKSYSVAVLRCDEGGTLQVRTQAGDKGVQAASQAVVHLGVGGRSREQQPEHQGEGRLGMGAVQTSGQVDDQRQTVERPGLDPTDTQGHSRSGHFRKREDILSVFKMLF